MVISESWKKFIKVLAVLLQLVIDALVIIGRGG